MQLARRPQQQASAVAAVAAANKNVLLQALLGAPNTLLSCPFFCSPARAAAGFASPYRTAAASSCLFRRDQPFCLSLCWCLGSSNNSRRGYNRCSSTRSSTSDTSRSSRGASAGSSGSRGTSAGRSTGYSSLLWRTEGSRTSSRGGKPPAAMYTGGGGIRVAHTFPLQRCSSSSSFCWGRTAFAWLRRLHRRGIRCTAPAATARPSPAAAEEAAPAAGKTAAGGRIALYAQRGVTPEKLPRPASSLLPRISMWALQQRSSFSSERVRPKSTAAAAEVGQAGSATRAPAAATAGEPAAAAASGTALPAATEAATQQAAAGAQATTEPETFTADSHAPAAEAVASTGEKKEQGAGECLTAEATRGEAGNADVRGRSEGALPPLSSRAAGSGEDATAAAGAAVAASLSASCAHTAGSASTSQKECAREAAAESQGRKGKTSPSGGDWGAHPAQSEEAANEVRDEQQQQQLQRARPSGAALPVATQRDAHAEEEAAAVTVGKGTAGAAAAAAETAAATASFQQASTCGDAASESAAAAADSSDSSRGGVEQHIAGRRTPLGPGNAPAAAPVAAANEMKSDVAAEGSAETTATGDDFAKNPDEMVAALDKYIVRQQEAKRCLAIALRDRWRRQQVKDEQLRKEICPNNLLLIGPSGCGKTELAKRLAAFAGAPFIKVAATRFTEVGFVGDDTSSVVRYLAQEALAQEKEKAKREVLGEAAKKAAQKVAEALRADGVLQDAVEVVIAMIEGGKLDDVEVNIDEALLCRGGDAAQDPLTSLLASLQKAVSPRRNGSNSSRSSGNPLLPGLLPRECGRGAAAGGGRYSRGGGGGGSGSSIRFPAASAAAQGVAFSLPLPPFFGSPAAATPTNHDGQQQKKLTVKKAVAAITDHFASEMTDTEEVRERAREAAETKGIIFLDEFDKLVEDRAGENTASSAFRSKKLGVQRELLTLMEGATVETCVGWVHTEHILFMASGSFLACKPSDIIPELQGRLPVRCDLKPLTEEDFYQILTETEYNLLVQQEALLATEGVKLVFRDDGIREVARVAFHLNTMNANVGARRLKTVLAKVLEDTKFAAHRLKGQEVVITKALVEERLQPLMRHADLCKYIL